MIAYIDEIHGSRVSAFDARAQELADALGEIGVRAGDSVHQSGRADYLIRFHVGLEDPDRSFSTPNVFLVEAQVGGVSLFEKVDDGPVEPVAELSWDDRWFDSALEAFQAFRDRLG